MSIVTVKLFLSEIHGIIKMRWLASLSSSVLNNNNDT